MTSKILKTSGKKIHRINGNQYTPVPVLTSNGQNSMSPLDKADTLAQHYSKVSSGGNIEPEVLAYQQKLEANHFDEINSPSLESEIYLSILTS